MEFWKGEVIQVKSLYEIGDIITTVFDDGSKGTVLLNADGSIQAYNATRKNSVFLPVNPNMPSIPNIGVIPLPAIP